MNKNSLQHFPLGAVFCALIMSHAIPAAAAETGKLPLTTAAAAPAPKPAPVPQATASLPQSAEYAGPTEVAPPLRLTSGKSALVRLPAEANRISIGNPEVADVMLINPREVYLLGKKVGTTNVFVWTKSGRTTIMDVAVSVDTATLKNKLDALVPGQAGVKIDSLADSVVLSGRVSDALKVNRMVSLAEVYSSRSCLKSRWPRYLKR